MEIIVSRQLNFMYIWFDIIFLCFLSFMLIKDKKFMTLLVALLGGLLYFIVDYGIFYKLLGTRQVNGADTFWFLFWISMSYGFTNFMWIWLWIARDRRLLEWSLLIVAGWITIPLLAQNFGSPFGEITMSRGTQNYHGVMALILFVGYAILCVMNIRQQDNSKRINIPWLLAIGILVQFTWEAVLLIFNIRSVDWVRLTVNSLVETNLGIPYMYFIYKAVSKRYDETFARKPLER